MANAEIDIKSVTDKMQTGDGCSLLFNKVFQDLNKDFDAQMKIVKKVEDEALSRSDNKLTFESIDKVGQDPVTKKMLELKGVNISLPEGPIFQEVLITDHESKRQIGVQKGCKPGPDSDNVEKVQKKG